MRNTPQRWPAIPQGAGGGGEEKGGEQREPKEEKNNLRSRSFARVMDLVSEGPIGGLCTRAGIPITNSAFLGQGIYLNGTPMIDPNGRRNFAGVSVAQVFGTQNQPDIYGFAAAEDTIMLGATLFHGVPIDTQIIDADTTDIIVGIKVANLFEQKKKTGDVVGTSVEILIEVWLRDVTLAATRTMKIKGKTQSEYVQELQIRLPRTAGDEENDEWNIKVTRLTEDPQSIVVQNATELSYITRVVGVRLRYPNSAIIASQFDAKAFQAVPTRGYHLLGRLIKVPSNYYPRARKYTRRALDGHNMGTEQPWDGTFYQAWSDNPAWCYYDLCVNTRYGLGDFLQAELFGTTGPRAVDKWTLYQIGRYCDEMVKNPITNRQEPRFTCNVYLQERAEAIKVLTDMASIFRGFSYWAQGTIVTVQDSPKLPLKQFTNASVKDGVFIYSSTAKRARHTVCLVRWNDPQDFYNAKFEYVSDDDGIAQLGIREMELSGWTTRRGQAIRAGKWALATELMETEIVKFITGLEGLYPKPGDIIKVYDQNRAGARHGGRVVGIAGDRQSVTLDKEVVLSAGAAYTLHLAFPQGFTPSGIDLTDSSEISGIRTVQLTDRAVTNAAGTHTVLTFSGGALPAEVVIGSVWGLETPSLLGQTFRVLSVGEQDNNEFEIQALEHNPGKFAAIENNLRLRDEAVTKLPNLGRVADPTNFRAVPGYNDTPEGFNRFIALSWKMPPNSQLRGAILEVKRGDDNWRYVAEVTAPSYTYYFTEKGSYSFRLFAVNVLGVRSSGVTVDVEIGAASSPSSVPLVTGLEVVGLDGKGKGLDPTFIGRDVSLQWRRNSPIRSYDFGGEPFGAAGDVDDPFFQDYEIRVYGIGESSPAWYQTGKSPRFTFTYQMNQEAFGNPRNAFIVAVNCRDKYNTSGAATQLQVLNPAPAAPLSVHTVTAFKSAFIKWQHPPENDLQHTEIWMGTGGASTFAGAQLMAQIPYPGNTWAYLNLTTGTTYRFWLREVDTFGSSSPEFPPDGSIANPGGLPVSDLDHLATELTGSFPGTIGLKGDRWSDNSRWEAGVPVAAAGRIAWNPHKIAFMGELQDIAAGDTPALHRYVWWRGPIFGPYPPLDGEGNQPPRPLLTAGEGVYRTSILHPKDKVSQGGSGEANLEFDFIIATNAEAAGLHDLAWRTIANALIGSAWIRDLAVTSAKIFDLTADKITGGTILGHTIEFGTEPGSGILGRLKSTNFVSALDATPENPAAGWELRSDGTAELANLILREKLALGTGYFNPAYPERLFYARPEIICPIRFYNAGWQQTPAAGAPNKQTLHYPGDPTRTRGMIFFYTHVATGGYLTAKTTPTPWNSPLFFGVDRDDYLFEPGDGSTNLFYRADPRRLGQNGPNIFTIEAFARCSYGFSVWYQIADNPVWLFGSTIRSMGNRRGPNATPLNPGAPWEFACEVLDRTGLAGAPYQFLSLSQRVEISVPSNKVILFAIGPVDHLGGRNTNAGSWSMYNGFLRVAAENVGNPLPNQEPPDEDGT